jgi:uncharacterized protein YpuA (DUF1002 family)
MTNLTKFMFVSGTILLALFALSSCTSAGAYSPETTTAVIGGGAAALLAFLRTLHESEVLSPEQFAKLSQSVGQVGTVAEATNATIGAFASAIAEIKALMASQASAAAADIAKVQGELAEKWSSSEILTSNGATAALAAGVTNYWRNKAREQRGEPIGHKPVA